MRRLYWFLLRLHPAPFRREYAGEMLWVFDEASASQGVWALFLDNLISLARQWVVRSGAWKIGVAILGAVLQVTLGGLGWAATQHPRIAAATAREQFKGEWVGEIKAAQGSQKMELQLVPEGPVWAGTAILDGHELTVSDIRVNAGIVRFRLNMDGSTLWFEGRRALRGGEVSGVVQGLGTFHLARD